ncbi:unnamed protein product [Urochloa decumbens]|uniref:VWFA domain-containing protein n=1 Tax=Urochloa decumbens TaxID=240449 RepID=A0ABC9AXY1_9POAL
MGRLRVTMTACLLAVLLAEMSTAADETVLVTSTAVFPMIPSKQEMKDFQVLLSVEAPRKGQRVHTDIIVVHRISSDDKGLFTKASKAIEYICKQLLLMEYKDKDKLTIKIVGPSRDINMPPAVSNLSNPREAKKPMENHSAGGATLGDLLKVAVTDLDDSGRTGQAERAGAIIVLTDRSESLGAEVEDLFKDKNYAVHAVGLGTDHNAMALRNLASASIGGTYSFVDKDDPGNITAALAVCVGGHKKVLVPGTSTLELKAEPGVTIKEIQYGSLHTPNDPTKPIKIGALHAGETKKILVSLDLPAEGNPDDKDSGCGAKTLLTASFIRSSNDKAPTTRVVCVERPQGAPALGQGAPPSPLVLQQIVRIKLVHTIIYQIINIPAEQVKEKLKIEWDKLVTTYQYWSGLDIFLGGLHQEIVTMQKYASDSPFWVYYINSWISSHETQRPTAMGSSDNVVGVFLTQEVNIMVQVAIQVTNNIDIFCQEYGYGELKCVDANSLVAVISTALNENGLLCSNNDANSPLLARGS